MVLPRVRRPVFLPLLLGALVLSLASPVAALDGVPRSASGVALALTPDKVMRAGVASVDASWHLGAGGGQFAETQPGAYDGDQVDPFLHATKKRPARGLQSRIVTRALLVEGVNAKRFAVVANDLYLPNDLLNRRVAQLLEQHDLAVSKGLREGPVTGITEDNLAITVSHNHNSAFYSTPSYGTWVFQDVFDLRFFEYMSTRMAQAVIDAATQLRPVRIGAVTVPFNEITAHTIGPKVADDGTPAGQPYAHTTGQLTVVRVDDLTNPTNPKHYANWITLGLHPEFTWGYELFSGDITHAAMRIVDRELGTTSVMSQRETGSSGPNKELRVHEPAERREFQESGWQQLDAGARLFADAVKRAYRALDSGEQAAPYNPHAPRTDGPPIEIVPFGSGLDVAVASERFAPPTMRPVPGVSNCNTVSLFHGNWQVPVLGFPDCADEASAVGKPVVGATPVEERAFYDQLKKLGVPVPESYFGPSFTLLEETAAVNLMAVRIGDIAATFCPCEQFTDTALNIQSRLNNVKDDVWRGFDWTTQKRPDGTAFCQPNADSSFWTCADPRSFREVGPWPNLAPVTDLQYRRMRAQINNDADGWEELANAGTDLFGEAEPTDPAKIKGNFTHREGTDYGATDGYGLTIAVGMANDYFGYTPEYREMRGYDHYRKALNGLGLHGADYLATRLVRLAASLRGGQPVTLSAQDLAYQAESGRARGVSQTLGELARAHTVAYDATLPADGGTPGIVRQPTDIKRFDGATVQFVGGSSYTDLPQVTVERLVGEAWVPFADQSGEVPTEVRFPTAEQMPSFAAGKFEWKWTASWEAFVSEVELPDLSGQGHRATPAGTYRFAVNGQKRTAPGDAVAPYSFSSQPFEVRPWDGLTVDALTLGDDGSVSVAVGPSTTEMFDGRLHAYGSIDYPDGWDWEKAIQSVADQRLKTEKGTFGEHGKRVYYRYRPGTQDDQAYCLFCRFHPWQESSEPAGGTVTVERFGGSVEQWPAVVSGRRLVAVRPGQSDAPGPGDLVRVAAGDVVDAWGNTNATGLSTRIDSPSASPSPSPTPTGAASSSPTTPPTESASGSASATPSSSSSPTASSTESGTSSPTTPSSSGSPSTTPGGSTPPPTCSATAAALPVRINTPTINATGLASVTVGGARPGARVELQGYSQNHEGTMTFDGDPTPVDRAGLADDNGAVTFNDLRLASNTRLRAHEAGCSSSADATSSVVQVRAMQTLRVVRNGARTYTFSGTSIPARPGGLIVSLYRVVGATCAAGVDPRHCPGEQLLRQGRAHSEGTPGAGTYGGLTVTFPPGATAMREEFVVKTGRDAQNSPGRSNVRSLLIY